MTDFPGAVITKDALYIDGQKVPGILRVGRVTLEPEGMKHVCIIAVEFIVGEIQLEDSCR